VTWIESHQSLGSHPKLQQFAAELQVSDPAAVGHLHYLWWWCIDYADDGDLSRYSDAVVAKAARWPGDGAEFVRGMCNAQLMHEDRTLHDWYDYAGKLIARRQKNKLRMCSARAAHVQDTCGATLPTLPTNPTSAREAKPVDKSPAPVDKSEPGKEGTKEKQKQWCQVQPLVNLRGLLLVDDWAATRGTGSAAAKASLDELARRTCYECSRVAAPATCRDIAKVCNKVFAARVRSAMKAVPKSMPRYLDAIDGAPAESLLTELTAAKRTAQGGNGKRDGDGLEKLAVHVKGAP
jgi:hypothetical protein